MKIFTVVGARPQFIKASIVSKKLREKGVKEILLHTGQHYDINMSDIFFNELQLPKPDYYLGIGSGPHGEQTGKMLIEIEKVLIKEKPDMVLVYGDTNSTLAGALAGAKLHIPVAHIEAGLRSFNKNMPEEINRVLTDHISDLLFCPTDIAVNNLKKEGIKNNVYKVGDVMLDLALEISKKIDTDKILKKYKLEPKDFILVTIHRAENTDDRERLEEIWNALLDLTSSNIKVFFPIHPRTKNRLKEYNLYPDKEIPNLILYNPISYTDMIALEKGARLIITDSGGIQKEGYFFDTPCIIPRNETEWVEFIEIGFNRLVEINNKSIYKKTIFLYRKINITSKYNKINNSLFSNGYASQEIVKILIGRQNDKKYMDNK